MARNITPYILLLACCASSCGPLSTAIDPFRGEAANKYNPVIDIPGVEVIVQDSRTRAIASHPSEGNEWRNYTGLREITACQADSPNDIYDQQTNTFVDFTRITGIGLPKSLDAFHVHNGGSIEAVHFGLRYPNEPARVGKFHRLRLSCREECRNRRPSSIVYGRLELSKDEPECSLFYRIVPESLYRVQLEVAGDGRVTLPDDELNPALTCLKTSVSCERFARPSSDASAILVARLETVPGEPNAPVLAAGSASENCVADIVPSGASRYQATVQVFGDGICRFDFPESISRVSLAVGPGGEVRYGIREDDARYTCGSLRGTSDTCAMALPDSAELAPTIEFEATPVDGFEPSWSDDCTANQQDPWTASLVGAVAGQSCRFELEAANSTPCDMLDEPRMVLSQGGRPAPSEEFFVRLAEGNPETLVDLDVTGQMAEPARFIWFAEDSRGAFTEIGRQRSLRNVPLDCPTERFCQIRLQVSDACRSEKWIEQSYRISPLN